MLKHILLIALSLILGTSVFASDYMNEVRSTADRSKSYFRIKKSDGVVQNLNKIVLPLTAAWIATTTAKVMVVGTAAGTPGLTLTSSTGEAKLIWPDGGTTTTGTTLAAAPVVWNLIVPEDYVTGCDAQIRFVASSASNVSSAAFLMTRISKNGGALTNVASSLTDISDSAYTEYVVDISTLIGMSTLAAGDVLSIAVARAEKTTTAATSTVWLRGASFEYNKNIDFGF